jgi:hypothetical protein
LSHGKVGKVPNRITLLDHWWGFAPATLLWRAAAHNLAPSGNNLID